jgi:ATP-dependent DNA helicase DinG
MEGTMAQSLPFPISKNESFYEKLSEWIGDVFYEYLPEQGFEIRDEQIYMAFQLEKAFKEKKVILAEAGVGTGKTIVYLLYAICYARYTGKPAIIACADETLIEQLVKKEGDIRKIERALNMQVDVRLAKSRNQYLCVKKLEQTIERTEDEAILQVYDQLPEFVYDRGSMLSFYQYGDRTDYPHLTDEQWKQINWDSLQDCFSCDLRHRCGQSLHREYYRKAADLIVCSHDFYMEHIWTKDARKREGQLPLLPEASCVVFDEGHLLEFACQKALTYKVTTSTFEQLLSQLMANDVREETLMIIEHILQLNDEFFSRLKKQAKPIEGTERQQIILSEEIVQQGLRLKTGIEQLLDELVFDAEMYVINEYDLKVVEEYLEQALYSLTLFCQKQDGIVWFEESNGESSLVIMPRLVQEILREEVFSQRIPFIFSSATLSQNKDFSYIMNSLGIDDALTFSVSSPFDYEEQMNLHVIVEDLNNLQYDYTANQIEKWQGRTLILFRSKEEMNRFRKWYEQSNTLTYPVLYEGDQEISKLVEEFQSNVNTVLCSYHLWEGLDVPGESLSNVMIMSLPFPPNDPVFEAKRKHSTNPFEEVDLPYMLLRLRQGMGRLIRTSQDKGDIHLFISKEEYNDYFEKLKRIFPVDPIIHHHA